MARYWKIVDQYGITVDKKEVDRELCKYFGVECHRRNYYKMWPDSIVYPFLYSDAADGTFESVRLWFNEDILDRSTYDNEILPVINWFKMKKYTPKRASMVEYIDPDYQDKLLVQQAIEN